MLILITLYLLNRLPIVKDSNFMDDTKWILAHYQLRNMAIDTPIKVPIT